MGKGVLRKRDKKKVQKKPDNEINGGASNQKPTNISRSKPEETNDTIFIRNLSFETDDEGLKKFIEENFGETIYCLVCRDKETDESKGTAFAKFKDPEDASKCMREFKDKEMQTKFHIDGRNVMVFPAISREKVGELKKRDETHKDKRNLSLAREGFIKPNSEEALELSKGDLEKRRVLDSRKRELLKNLHNFVSDTRLCIHNLPPFVDDAKLRQIFMSSIRDNYPDAKVIECKVMRNKKGSGELGASKGFGFVAFSKHEHSLAALRALNNNPKAFNSEKRPIVEFSIENLVALNKKKTRLANSKRKLEAEQAKQGHEQNMGPAKNKGNEKKSRLDRKRLKKRPTVQIKTLDASERENLLKKTIKTKARNSVKKSKKKNSVGKLDL